MQEYNIYTDGCADSIVDFNTFVFVTENLAESSLVETQGLDSKDPLVREYAEWEAMMNKNFDTIGTIEGLKIVRSGHFDTPRYPQEMEGKMTFAIMREEGYPMRGEGLSEKTMIEAIKKAITKYTLKPFKQNDKVLLVYKNKKGTYDSISVRYQNNTLQIVTAMQQKRKSPAYNPQKNQYKMIVESKSVFVVYL